MAFGLILLTGCSISLTDPTAVPTALVPSVGPPGQPSPTPPGGATKTSGTGDTDWAALGLSGRLVYSLGSQGIHQLDLTTGTVATVFQPPKDAWLMAVSVSPDGQQIALAYAPPPESNQVQLGYTSLYLLPGDCGTRPDGCTPDDLKLLLARVDPHEAYFSPVWSLDSQNLYTAHFTPSDSTAASAFKYTLERIKLPDGAPEVLLQDALWPNIAPDGSLIVYVYSDPVDYTNHLYVAGENGENPRALIGPGQFTAVDAPFFTPDGSQVIFSAVGEGPAALSWLDRLLGVRHAEAAPNAHNVPSDWWEINLDGSGLKRLTKVYDTSMFGAFAPDGLHIAFLSASGLYVMNPDGSGVQRILKTTGYGSVDWVK